MIANSNIGEILQSTAADQAREEYLLQDLTSKIIKCYYDVYNNLGYGFLERVYENALKHEMDKAGLNYKDQHEIKVFYDGIEVGFYICDFLVEDRVIVEIKAVEELTVSHDTQLINYLRATSVEVGLLLNFGKKPTIKRRSFLNSRKSLPSSFS